MKSLGSVEILGEMRRRIQSLRIDDRARWGTMTVKQMVRHLGHSYELALGERVAAPVKGMPPLVMKWVALRSGLPLPKNVSTPPELKRAIAEESDVEFRAAVKMSIKKMEQLAVGMRCASRHPMFGKMTIRDWMRLAYLHADHHLRQFGR